MSAIGKTLMSLGLLALVAVVSPGCGDNHHGMRHERSSSDVTVGGRKGVVVERDGGGTAVKVGGNKGVVVGNPRD